MAVTSMDRSLAARMIVSASRRVAEHQDELSRLDAVAGDGDHGVNMAEALAEAGRRIGGQDDRGAAGVFRTTGGAFHETVGGAAGALFGAFFGAAAGRLSGIAEPDASDFVAALGKGTTRVMRLGRAEPGHKTMLDALAPAVEGAGAALEAGEALAGVMSAAARAARRGAVSTAGMPPKAGRARYAPDRSLGYQDPGATTVALIFEAWADEMNREEADR